MTRYVIIGAGAVGATVAAQLHQAGRSVILVARGANLEVLCASGLRYIRPHGPLQLDVPVAGGPQDVALRQDDVLVLASKSQDTEDILRTWAWLPVDGKPNMIPFPAQLDTIQRQQRLGGLLNEYRPAA